jgi:pimeloyl-ACP methyl ester carboxylesterase
VHAGVHAGELRALLRAAGERGPFLLVGHSYGGMVARALLAQWPALVAGLVLQDSVPPGVQLRYDDYGRTRAEGGAVVDYDLSSQATAGLAPLAGLPLVVLAAGRPVTWAPDWVRAWWAAEQHRTALASSMHSTSSPPRPSTSCRSSPPATSTSVTVLRRRCAGVWRCRCGASWQRLGVTCRRS